MSAVARPAPMARPGRGWTTPVTLQAWGLGLVLLVALAAAGLELSVAARHRAVNAALLTSEPLLVNAQSVYTHLSDADTTAAGGFLSGAGQAQVLRARYSTDLAQSAASLTAAAQEAAGDPQLARSIQEISVDLSVYSGLVETARANSRLGYPVGASYLGEASNLMRTKILPAASAVYVTERARLEGNRHTATAKLAVTVALIVLLVGVGVIVALQRWLGRRFRRLLSVPLLIGLLVLVITGGWVLIAVQRQGSRADTAETTGVAPLGTFAQARILELQARADDDLTLVTRDGVPAYQTDFASVTRQLGSLLSHPNDTGDGAVLTAARASLTQELALHRRIRADDQSGNLTGAIALATGPGATDLPAVANRLEATLGSGVTAAQGRFISAMSDAGSAETGLTIAIPFLALLCGALIVLALRPRLAEYR